MKNGTKVSRADQNRSDVREGDEWEDRRKRSKADPLTLESIPGDCYPVITVDEIYLNKEDGFFYAAGTRSITGRKTTIKLMNFNGDHQLYRIKRGNGGKKP